MARVGHDLRSCTTEVEQYIVPHPKDSTCRVILVDTPGFNHTTMDDNDILRRISQWLAKK